jgi:hypothetical protein
MDFGEEIRGKETNLKIKAWIRGYYPKFAGSNQAEAV